MSIRVLLDETAAALRASTSLMLDHGAGCQSCSEQAASANCLLATHARLRACERCGGLGEVIERDEDAIIGSVYGERRVPCDCLRGEP